MNWRCTNRRCCTGKNLYTSVNVDQSGTSGLFIYVWYIYDTSRAKGMTTFDEYNNNIEKYPTLLAFSKVELWFPIVPIVYEDAAIGPLLQVAACSFNAALHWIYYWTTMGHRLPNTRFYGVCRNNVDFLYLIPILCQFWMTGCNRQAALHHSPIQ